MFERFTTRARQAIVAAQEEARRLGHAYIGTEHVLLGVLVDRESLGCRALNQLGVTLESARTGVVGLIGTSDEAPSGHIPFTPRAKKVLELSLREAVGLGHNYIGTEHVVLGLVREGEGVAAQVLQAQGVSGEQLRAAILAELRTATADRAPAGTPSTTPGADGVLAAARQLAGGAPMGTHHLLEAMALVEGSVAGNVLAALGLDADALGAKIDEAGIEGTSDITPDLAAARQMEVQLDEDVVRIVFGDATMRELVGKLTESLGNPIRGVDGVGDSLIELWQANVVALQHLVAALSPDDGEDPGRHQPRRHRARHDPQPPAPPTALRARRRPSSRSHTLERRPG